MLAPDTLLKDRYRILHKIGGGGFGYVYKAVDEVFGCSVAIKETREEVAGLDKFRKAFEREARLLRNLKHEALPRVTDYFFEDRSQFLVMDFIDGEDLAARLSKRMRQSQGAFTCQELLPWADKILAALEYLHSRPEPILHRDIKPSNIKLTDEGEVYLLDFGLAKGVAGQMSTLIEGEIISSVIGFTREYAPLEQLQSTGTEPQSDIYALGATLYHLMTGRIPISAPERDESLQRGKGDPLRPAHEVSPAIPLAVSQIIERAMAVRWWDRTESAKEMRSQLARACADSAVAQPGPTAQITSPSTPVDSGNNVSTLKLLPLREPMKPNSNETTPPVQISARQSRLRPSWVKAGVTLVLLIGLIVVARFAFPQWFRAEPAAKVDAQGAAKPDNLKPPGAATPVKLSVIKVLGEHTNDPDKHIWSVAFSRDGELAASASEDSTIILWDTKTWQPKFPPLRGHEGAVYSVAFSPDGKILASGGGDATIRLWETQTGKQIDTLSPEKKKAVLRVAFSPDGELLASCSGALPENGGEEIVLWEARQGWNPTVLDRQAGGVFAIAFSPDGNTLASAGLDNRLLLWDIAHDKRRSLLSKYNHSLTTIAFSADGKYMACGSADHTVKMWRSRPQSMPQWEELSSTGEQGGIITSIALSSDNKTLVSASRDATIRLWDVSTQTPGLLWEGVALNQSSRRVVQWAVAFSPDGQTLLTGDEDNVVRVWQ